MTVQRPSSSVILAAALAAALAGCARGDAAPAAESAPAAEAAPAAPATPEPAPAATSATAHVGGNEGAIAGDLNFTGDADGVHITGTLTGLAADTTHGLHLHDTGDCSDAAGGSAGLHFNPDAQPHGGPDAAARHAGDLPNIVADASGTAPVDVRVAGLGVGTRDARDVAGRAIVVHEKADDYATQPSGGSGTPIACGVIELAAIPAAAPPAVP